ncbi:MAG: ABC transporter permease [Pirellulales bacterium]
MNARQLYLTLLNLAPVFLLVALGLALGAIAGHGRFLDPQNLLNILIQSSSTAIAAVGMTLVLLTAGVDLSVGNLMLLTAAVTGQLIVKGYSLPAAVAAGLIVGAAGGFVNGILITRLKLTPFIATLGTYFVMRGLGLWLTQTRQIRLPDEITSLGASRPVGVPMPVIVLVLVCLAAHWFLKSTPWGRQVYAIGSDSVAAQRAGIQVRPLLIFLYTLCGLCAALSALVAMSQTGAVSPSFGDRKELAAIAAAVLGGTSVFGGRGQVLPGTLLGALLFQTIENGLVIMNASPLLYPMILSTVIFLAVLLDTFRSRLIEQLSQRPIRRPDSA